MWIEVLSYIIVEYNIILCTKSIKKIQIFSEICYQGIYLKLRTGQFIPYHSEESKETEQKLVSSISHD